MLPVLEVEKIRRASSSLSSLEMEWTLVDNVAPSQLTASPKLAGLQES
jgi:hypothetical protein